MDPKNYFQHRLDQTTAALVKLKRRSLLLSMLRLVVFLLTGILVYFFLENTVVIATSLLLGFASFLWLVARYTDVRHQRDFHQKLVDLNEAELKAMEGDYSHFDAGAEFLAGDHYYNQDIDLFGEGSLFQAINRAGTLNGKRKLAQILNSNNIDNIEDKQQAIQELATDTEWRQAFQITASMIENEVETNRVIEWMKHYKPAIPSVFSVVPMVYVLISLVSLIGYGLGWIPGIALLFVFLGGLAITGIFLNRISRLYLDAGKMKETFAQYSKLIKAIEETDRSADLLVGAKNLLKTEGINASRVLGNLSREINSLDQRNNVFFGLLANGFLLWDLRYSYRIEKWMRDNEATIEKWFEGVVFFDAYNGLANFAFARPHYNYPHLKTDEVILQALSLGHPLLPEERRVDNDLDIAEGNFFIITGANMAGKSTFLRTVALNIVMANCGLPVCARIFNYRPVKLISSMRTSDSLKDDESYFFSELKRLKFIVDEIQRDTYFIILDEILKGTNSKDKAEGSQQFVERLVESNSTGLIATHDLSLCQIADKLPQVKNHYFDAQIVDNELYFDYRFKDGICQNMNASFLLKKMGIV